MTNFKIGDIIEFNESHIKPGTNRKIIIIGKKENEYSVNYIANVKFYCRAGGDYHLIKEFPYNCALVELAKKVGEVNSKLSELLYGYE